MRILFKLVLALLFTTIFISGQIVDPQHPNNHKVINPEMNDYCRSCHSCENPTKFNPCLMQCARPGGQFSSKQTYKAGPKIVLIDKLMKLYKAVVFSHELHASMSDMSGGCTLCHHYSEKSGEIPPCSKCHTIDPYLANLSQPSLKGAYHRQCLGCHKEWSHGNACQFCHVEVQKSDKTVKQDKTDIIGVPHPRIEAEEKYVYKTKYTKGPIVTFHHTDHVNLFGLNCTDCHKGDNCNRCHDIDKPVVNRRNIEHVETCCNCHVEKNCGFCHSTKEKPAFSHYTSTGFELSHYHKNVDCNKCHNSVSNFVTPSTKCDDCHIHWEVDVFNHNITGLTLSDSHIEMDCENCHLDRDFRVEPTCNICHDDIEYPEYSPGIHK